MAKGSLLTPVRATTLVTPVCSGKIDYKEFVAALARDQVIKANAAVLQATVLPTPTYMCRLVADNNWLIPAATDTSVPRRTSFALGAGLATGLTWPNPKTPSKTVLQSAEDAINARFANMHAAFKSIDLDRSGTISKDELARALELWNIPVTGALDAIMSTCDKDGNDGIDYKEFTDVLARDNARSHVLGA